jgi:putative ABC transport system permease protein
MKAIGATNHRILGLFLIESSIVGFIGGLVGVIIGYALSIGVSASSIKFMGINLSVAIDPVLVVSMLVFATIVGAMAGTYPARRASKMDPVEALRYE